MLLMTNDHSTVYGDLVSQSSEKSTTPCDQLILDDYASTFHAERRGIIVTHLVS